MNGMRGGLGHAPRIHLGVNTCMAVPREWGHTIDEARELTAMGAPEGVPIVLCLDIGHPCPLRTGTASDDPMTWLHVPWARTAVLHLR